MFDDYPYHIEVACPSGSSSPSYRRHESCCLICEAMQMAEIDEIEMQYGARPVATGQSRVPVDLRPAAAAGRCTRCGRATWQHQGPRYLWPVRPHHPAPNPEVRMVGLRRVMPYKSGA